MITVIATNEQSARKSIKMPPSLKNFQVVVSASEKFMMRLIIGEAHGEFEVFAPEFFDYILGHGRDFRGGYRIQDNPPLDPGGSSHFHLSLPEHLSFLVYHEI